MTLSVRTLLTASCALGAVMISPAAAQQAIEGVPLEDPNAALAQAEAQPLEFNFGNEVTPRFNFTPSASPAFAAPAYFGEQRGVELEFAAAGDSAGVPLDVAVAQRATLRADADGEISGGSSGSELRIGRGLVQRGNDRGENSSIYFFVADDDEALTWRFGQASNLMGRGGALALQEERVEVGDMSAGVTYERNGVQASLAYVEREVSARIGRESFSQDENFAGFTLTMRR